MSNVLVYDTTMDRTIDKIELEKAEEILSLAIKNFQDILYNIEKEAKNDYDNILSICDKLSFRIIRLWHKYKFNQVEEKLEIKSS
jgi:hypothetical protein